MPTIHALTLKSWGLPDGLFDPVFGYSSLRMEEVELLGKSLFDVFIVTFSLQYRYMFPAHQVLGIVAVTNIPDAQCDLISKFFFDLHSRDTKMSEQRILSEIFAGLNGWIFQLPGSKHHDKLFNPLDREHTLSRVFSKRKIKITY